MSNLLLSANKTTIIKIPIATQSQKLNSHILKTKDHLIV